MKAASYSSNFRQKEFDAKYETKSTKYLGGKVSKSQENYEDKNKLNLNPEATSYVPAKMGNNEERYCL